MNRSITSMLVATFVLRVSTAITGGMLVYLVDDLTRHGGHGPVILSFLTGGFYATELTGAIVFGILADRYGRKVIMILGPLFGSIAVFMTGLTTHLPVLFVTRLLEGSSTAASIPSTLGFIAAETAHDEKLRGRVVSLFELVSLGGMLAVGPALAGLLWDAYGRPAFFLNCVLYLVALALYAYGVAEVPRDRQRDLAGSPDAAPATVTRYLRIVRNRKVLLFAPTWLAINAILGLWALQAPLLIKGNMQDSSQFLMRGISASAIGLGAAVLAVIFGAGILFWGTVYARFRRTTLLLLGVGAFVAMTIDVLAVNHFGGSSDVVLAALGLVAVVALFVMSGATPAALGLLADVSEGFEEDRSALMGLYSVFLGLGQVMGAVIGGIAASWKGIDGLVVATVGLLAVGIAALLNLRAHESVMLDGPTAGLKTALTGEAFRGPIPATTADRRKP
ncbi:MAG: MFS transporter [Candidatus Limnocylindrales bacterium]